MQIRRFAPAFLMLALAVIVLTGCGLSGGGEAEPKPTATSEPQASPTATPDANELTPSPEETYAYTQVSIPEAGLTFEVPESWTQVDDMIWAPASDADFWVGVKWAELNPPQEPEAVLLPENAQIVSSEEVETSLGNARRFLVSVYAPATEGGEEDAVVASVETHVLVIISDADTRRGYDFYAAGDDEDDLPQAQSVLDHLVATASLEEGIDEDPEAAIRASVAESLNARPEEVAILELEPREWPDACLGVSQEGQACAEVVTPGYKATVRVGTEVYEVRTDEDATQVVVVPDETDEAPSGGAAPPPAVDRARSILADHLGVPGTDVELLSFEQVEWPDACLGIRNPNQACAQVITPGYRIIFDISGTEREVHTDLTGDAVGIVPAP